MGLQAVYEQFLKRPNAAILADDAILQYVTTLKPYTRNTKIVEHLGEQEQNVVKKRTEKVISGVEGLTAVALIVETTLQFISSGGAYLPGLDSFILDKTATLPIVSALARLSTSRTDSSRHTLYISTKTTRSHKSD